MALISVAALQHRYGARKVLDLPAWQVESGQHQLILGPSGCGKSTLLAILAGMLQPSAGTVSVAGHALDQIGPAARDAFRARHVGLVLQRLHLIPALTVRQNLRLAQTLAGLPVDDRRIDAALGELGIAAKAHDQPAQLSAGEAQRVAIARAVVNRPALILADEPTAALDDASCAAALELLLAQAAAHQATLIIATHDQRIKARFADRLDLASSLAAAT